MGFVCLMMMVERSLETENDHELLSIVQCVTLQISFLSGWPSTSSQPASVVVMNHLFEAG